MVMRLGIVVAFCLTLVGCSAQLKDYQGSEPQLDLFVFFSGESHAWGMIQDYSGKKTRSFEVIIVGSVVDNRLTLVEDFVFNDGEQSQRIWYIDKQPDGSYQGRASDVVGVAQGKEVGNAMFWSYDLVIPWDDSEIEVRLEDWLYRQDEKRLFNIAKIKKFGLEVGQITLFFEKQ
ncbi:DUF3833 domain-containing protein [Vibrio intestinalis]|uniref:DUF3833 domain-containing protein n=1 Tax=Vibrio intestinalis TaxID=2933291 RepID=UPI003D814D6D